MKTVLVVDDDAATLDLLEEVLSDAGYQVRLAVNGQAGLDDLLLHRPDVVISDLWLPVLDGVAMAAAIRADPRYHTLPLIAITAAPQPDATVHALFTRVLIKPFPLAALVATVEQVLTLSA